MVDARENTTTALCRHRAMRTIRPTSSPAMNAAASASPSKNECMESPMKADIEVMSCSQASHPSYSSFPKYFFTRKSIMNSRRNPANIM